MRHTAFIKVGKTNINGIQIGNHGWGARLWNGHTKGGPGSDSGTWSLFFFNLRWWTNIKSGLPT